MRLLLLSFLAVGLSQAAELAIPDDVTFTRDVEYSDVAGQHLQVNVAQPKEGTGPFPAVVCIHGGGFRAGIPGQSRRS